VTVFFGAMALGSVLWGEVARLVGVPGTLLIAAVGQLLAIPLTWRWRLQSRASTDLTPSMHWPTPIATKDVGADQGPVLVIVEYRVNSENRSAFLRAIAELSQQRGRDGAYGWGLFQDVTDHGRLVETFFTDSWLEHLRQHERATNAERVVEEGVNRLASTPPKIVHLAAVARTHTMFDVPHAAADESS
jgi:hypothetical protein